VSLEEWAEYGWLKAEPTSRDEIKSLMTIVDRDLKDANVAAVSQDRRFEAAFNAALTCANIALRASGYRTSTQAGHHIRTIELSLKADTRLIQKMKTLSKKRNATSYDSAGNVSKQELELAMRTGTEVRRQIVAWLEQTHPELLKD